MPTFVIERVLPGAGLLTADEVHTVAAVERGPRRHGTSSAVAPQLRDERQGLLRLHRRGRATIREHADRVGVPVTAVNQITSVLDPSTGV